MAGLDVKSDMGLDDASRRSRFAITGVAQFLTLCRAYNLAEAPCLFSPGQGASPTKMRASSKPSRAHRPHRQFSTNCEKLRERPIRPRSGYAAGVGSMNW